ncbi:MAG: hypothetical protein R2816_12935 [Flavobacteriaceae bacterium]
MGTRSLTVVVHNNAVKFAQYGQFDGYPESLGVTLLKFFNNTSNREALKSMLPKMRLWNENDQKQELEFLQPLNCENSWMNKEQQLQYQKRYPLRYLEVYGKLKEGKLLELLLQFNWLDEIVTTDSYEFAKDSLYCEWAYIIDFDKNVFEVYKGLNTMGIAPEDRFFSLYEKSNEYYPVKIIRSFPINELPDADEFLLLCNQNI